MLVTCDKCGARFVLSPQVGISVTGNIMSE